MRKVYVLDTSVLCCYLAVPGRERCGPAHDVWDTNRIRQKIQAAEQANTATILVPIAALIETANFIASLKNYALAEHFAVLLRRLADEQAPWGAASDETELWSADAFRKYADTWPQEAARGISLADRTVAEVARRQLAAGFHVEILTGDAGLKSLEPTKPVRRRRRRDDGR